MAAAEARPEPPRRVRAALESGEPKGGLVSRSLRSIGLLIPLPWGWAGPGPSLAPKAWEAIGSRAPSPSSGDLHSGSAQRPLPNQEYRPRAGPPGRIDPSKARDLKMSNLPFPGGWRGRGLGGGRLGNGGGAGG